MANQVTLHRCILCHISLLHICFRERLKGSSFGPSVTCMHLRLLEFAVLRKNFLAYLLLRICLLCFGFLNSISIAVNCEEKEGKNIALGWVIYF